MTPKQNTMSSRYIHRVGYFRKASQKSFFYIYHPARVEETMISKKELKTFSREDKGLRTVIGWIDYESYVQSV